MRHASCAFVATVPLHQMVARTMRVRLSHMMWLLATCALSAQAREWSIRVRIDSVMQGEASSMSAKPSNAHAYQQSLISNGAMSACVRAIVARDTCCTLLRTPDDTVRCLHACARSAHLARMQKLA